MKICAIICEFNPFHNGHAYLISVAKQVSGCDDVLCIMSENFTQHGEICVCPPSARARHAVLSGADAVLGLPAAFSVAPAEIFAEGAIKILSSIPEVTHIVFGCESGTEADFLRAAEILRNENANFSRSLKAELDSGESYVKAYARAFLSCGGDEKFISSPNNILGIEYAKAIFKAHSHIKICPVARKGANFSDTGLKDNFSSAQAIRENMLSPLVKANVPEYVLGDLHDFSKQKELFESLCAYSLVAGNLQNLKRIYGCTEGLEHKIFNLRGKSYKEIVKECTSKRYTASRIKRILLANLLNMYKDDVQKYLAEPLYLKPLAASKGRADEILSCLSKAEFKLLLKFNDIENLSEIARKCIEKDIFAAEIYNFTVNSPTEPFPYMQII